LRPCHADREHLESDHDRIFWPLGLRIREGRTSRSCRSCSDPRAVPQRRSRLGETKATALFPRALSLNFVRLYISVKPAFVSLMVLFSPISSQPF
jgi:hypothetical protein